MAGVRRGLVSHAAETFCLEKIQTFQLRAANANGAENLMKCVVVALSELKSRQINRNDKRPSYIRGSATVNSRRSDKSSGCVLLCRPTDASWHNQCINAARLQQAQRRRARCATVDL